MKTWFVLPFVFFIINCFAQTNSKLQVSEITKNQINNWVVTDALGRTLPTFEDVGPIRENRKVGVFYYLWSGYHGTKVYDITKIIQKNPVNPLSSSNPDWGPKGSFHFWGEPEYGYFRSEDPWVIQRDLQMLSNAQVDFIFFDVTNGYTYLETVKTLCEVSISMRNQGIPTPEICFLTNSNTGKTMNTIYDEFYSKGLYKDLWFYWNGKPLIMGKWDDTVLRPEVRNFFTIKYSWAWTKTQTEPNHWQWLDKYPQDYGWSLQASKPEQITVSVAHHPSNPLGKSYNGGSQPTVDANYLTRYTNEGLQFEEQWYRAFQVDPEVVMVTQWNEWLAQRFTNDNAKTTYGGRPINPGDTHFVDVFTAEFNRDIAPMKGGYTDNYYYQLVTNIRKYKGMEAPQIPSPAKTMVIDGDFSEWAAVTPSFGDPVDDTKPRDFEGYDKSVRYTNTTGRNDIVESKVTFDKDKLYFYVKTNKELTSSADMHWMLLFLDADKNMTTGWEGYDYVINHSVNSSEKTFLKTWDGTKWGNEQQLTLSIKGNEMELAISRTSIKLQDKLPDFYFKWADNPGELKDVTTFFLNGDAAPDRRFKYHFKATNEATSLNKMNNNNQSIKVSPNPADEKLRIDLAKESKLEIFNSLGKRVFESSGSARSFELNVSTWTKGVYVAKSNLSASNSTCKFLIQ